MYQIDIYKSIQRQIDKIKEYVELAIKIQQAPNTKKSAEDLAELLGMIQKRADHLFKQLNKGIAFEKEVDEVEAMAKELPGAEIYIVNWGSNFDQPDIAPFSKN